MFTLSHTPEMTAQIYKSVMRFSRGPRGQTDAMQGLLMMAGMVVESSLVFDESPDEAACAALNGLAERLGTRPNVGKLGFNTLPPSALIDQTIEKGRMIAREALESWECCAFDAYAIFLEACHGIFREWDEAGFRRAEMLRLLSECVYRGLAYEISAQELCDVLIERKARVLSWDLNSCIAALSAMAGQRLASSARGQLYADVGGEPEELESVIYTMTQEAVRLGVPAGTSWRFGVPANDVPLSVPYRLIDRLNPECDSFFASIQLFDREDQAVACAKAAGRMLAITAGGDLPEIEPVIAKPLALSAMSDTYKVMCMDKMHHA